jgi:hypothetical protein
LSTVKPPTGETRNHTDGQVTSRMDGSKIEENEGLGHQVLVDISFAFADRWPLVTDLTPEEQAETLDIVENRLRRWTLSRTSP